jgi:hypothetical protein
MSIDMILIRIDIGVVLTDIGMVSISLAPISISLRRRLSLIEPIISLRLCVFAGTAVSVLENELLFPQRRKAAKSSSARITQPRTHGGGSSVQASTFEDPARSNLRTRNTG